MSTAPVTISIASPAVIGWSSHGFSAGQAVWFAQDAPLGYLPTGVLPGILYYVLAAGLTADTFEIAAEAAGVAINTSGTQSGVITGTSTSSVLNTFCPPVGPSPGTKNKPEIKLKEAAFGDGYTQTTRDGLNYIRKVVTLQWDVLIESEASAIENFILTQGGDTPFYFALRGDISRKWTCKDYDRAWKTPNTVSATFREDFSLLV